MYAAFRHVLRHRGRLQRPAVSVSTTGATLRTFNDLSSAEVQCFVGESTGRMRTDDSGQYGGRRYQILFGPETQGLQQGDLLVVTYPASLGTYRITRADRVMTYGIGHVEADAEQYMPAGSD
jgi:hypothetical protein